MSELPIGWINTTLGELIEPYVSIDPRNQPDKKFRYIDIGSIDNRTQEITDAKEIIGRDAPSRARRLVRHGDVLFSTVRTYLKNVVHVPPSLDGALTSTGIAVLRASGAIEQRYLFNWVRSAEFIDRMSKAQDGTLYPAVRDSDVNSGQVRLPPLAEQRRIVSKLDALLGYEARARTALDHIPALVAQHKKAVLSAAFSGDLTASWRAKSGHDKPPFVRLEDVATDFSYGSAAKSSKSGTVPVLRMGNIQNGKLDWRDLVYTSNPAEISKYSLERGDILFNRTNSPALVGKTAIYRGERKAIYAGYLIRVRCSDALRPDYLAYCLNSPQGRSYSWKVKTDGVSQSNINAKKLAAFSFRLPSLAEQCEIVRLTNAAVAWLDRVAAEQETASRLLLRLDEAILAKAFRGELVLQDATDEPASLLLERMRADREQQPERQRISRRAEKGKAGERATRKRRKIMGKKRSEVGQDHLRKTLNGLGGSAPAREVWRASEMDIDEFYKLLRDEVKAGRIREGASKDELV